MELTYKQRAGLYTLGIIIIVGGCLILEHLDILKKGVFIFAILGCYSWIIYLWNVVRYEMRNTVHKLKRALPKLGFEIESLEWNDDKTIARISGKYKGDAFIIDASKKSAYIDILDLPWSQVNATDPLNIQLVESINAINCQRVGPRVVLLEPNEEGIRHIMTVHTTILPEYNIPQFLDSTLIDMLNRKPALRESLNQEKSWLNKQRNTIGFNVPQ